MKQLVNWFANNHVAANLFAGLAVVAGFVAMLQIPVKVNPDVDHPTIGITVPYLGAAPKEVESAVCTRVEERLTALVGVKEVYSLATDGACQINVQLTADADGDRVLAEVQNQVDAIDTFPEQVERPIIRFVEYRTSVVMELAVTGPTDEKALKEIGQQLRDDILALPDVSRANLANVRPDEISVEVSERSLLRNGLTFDDVAEALRKRSIDLPGGTIKTDRRDTLLRTRGQVYHGDEIEKLVLTTRTDGTRVLLGDVAEVIDGFEDTGQTLQIDGAPAALVQVARVGDEDLRQISESVREFVSQSAGRYPEGTVITIWNDESQFVRDRLGTLIDSGVLGLLLILILLALFLRPHIAIWVAAGIPIALLGAVAILYWLGHSIDSIAILGFIIALGLVVDDAVVVGESVHAAHKRGLGQLAGAIDGAQRVLVPVTFGVLTTVAAFTPLLFADGPAGELLAVIAVTVMCCLAFSLAECQWMLPAHLGHRTDRMPLGDFGMTLLATLVIGSYAAANSLRGAAALMVIAVTLVIAAYLTGWLDKLGQQFTRVQLRFENAFESFVETRLRDFVVRAVDARRLTLAIALIGLALPLAVVVSGHLPYVSTAPLPGDIVAARLTMPVGTGAGMVSEAVTTLGESARRVQRELAETGTTSPILHIMEVTGGHPSVGAAITSGPKADGPHLGEVVMQIAPGRDRTIETEEIEQLWRNANTPIAGAVKLAFSTSRVEFENDIDIRFTSDSIDELGAAASQLRLALSEYPGVYDVADSMEPGKDELEISILPAGEALGITLSDLGRQVRQAFYGEEAQRLQRGREEVRVMVRFPKEERDSLDALFGMHVRTPNGGEVPLRTVAEVKPERGFASISRTNGRRSVNVTARVDASVTSAGAVVEHLTANVLPGIFEQYQTVSHTVVSNQFREELSERLGQLFLIALFAMYALLAVPLKSFSQPLIIMSVVPFAFAGAVVGHLVMGAIGVYAPLGRNTPFGAVAATGLAINASLVLLHEVNDRMQAGESMRDALINGAVVRARPVVITTASTFAGLLPLMLTQSNSAQTMIPMAIALAWGVLFGSCAALFVTPAIWLVVRDLTGGAKRSGGFLADKLSMTAPRLTMMMARFPYIRESLNAREFTDLEIPDDTEIDEETKRIAQQGLVRLYYVKEFDLQEMHSQLALISRRALGIDNLVKETRIWAEQRMFQLGVHLTSGLVKADMASRTVADILDACLLTLLRGAEEDLARRTDTPDQTRTAGLVVLGAAGRREPAIGSQLELMLLPIESSEVHEELESLFMRLVRDLSPESLLYQPAPLRSLDISESILTLSDQDVHLPERTTPAELRLLVHARAATTGDAFSEAFERLRIQLLCRNHDRDALLADMSAVRAHAVRMYRGAWDVRHTPGGLMDVELLAEYLQLMNAASTPEILVHGLTNTFEFAQENGLIDDLTATDLAAAANLWQTIDCYFRVAVAGDFDPDSASQELRSAIATATNLPHFGDLAPKMSDTAERVARHLNRLTGL